jgi:hypothetical protein
MIFDAVGSNAQQGTANELSDDSSFENITVFQEISQYVKYEFAAIDY